jgi:hypothetical protein
MAPADDDNEEPVPWRADPGRSETRWEPVQPRPRYAAPRSRRWLVLAVALTVVIVIIPIVVRYLSS